MSRLGVEVPRSNHFIVYSNPEFLYKSIAEFLNGSKREHRGKTGKKWRVSL